MSLSFGTRDDELIAIISDLLAQERATRDDHGLSHHFDALLDQVMSEGGFYAPTLAARAITQADGDPVEASFLLRAYRTTLPRIGYTLPTDGRGMRLSRRVSPIYKEVIGGQILGRTRDFTQRLLELDDAPPAAHARIAPATDGTVPHDENTRESSGLPRILELLRAEGVIPSPTPTDVEPFDVTRAPIRFPTPRSARLQTLARGETGFMVGLAYSTMRGFGTAHPLIAELRQGELPVQIQHPLTGDAVTPGSIALTAVDIISYAPGVLGARSERQADEASVGKYFHQGYGIAFGRHERRAIAMGILDLNLNAPNNHGPAASEEFVLSHCDGVAASGLVEHLKLPHYVGFQSTLDRVRFRRLHALVKQSTAAGGGA